MKYGVIYADPPWRFSTYSSKGQKKAPDRHYPTMKIEDICALPVPALAADDAALFLWVYQPMLRQAFLLFDVWGFEFKTVAYIWVKTNGHQDRLFYGGQDAKKSLGYHTRAGSEQCWLATKGRGYKRLSKAEPQVVFAPRREHSRKPDEIAESIVRLTGPETSRIELFARTERPGWAAWGNEVDKFKTVSP